MMFGRDFFKIISFAMAILKLFAQIFGDEDDRRNGDNGPDVKIHVDSKSVDVKSS